MGNRIALITLSIILLIIPGCAGKIPPGAPGGEAPAVITVWYALNGKSEQELKNLLLKINQKHPEVIARGEKIAETEFVDKAWNLQAGGEGPEIFIASRQTIFELFAKGAISPLLADNSEIFPSANSVFSYNGQLYAAAWLTDIPLLYYRKDRVPAPTGFAELLEKKAVIAVRSLDTGLLSFWWKAEGGGLSLGGIPTLNSEANLAYLNKVLGLRSEGVLVFGEQAITKFINGDADYLLAWASDSTALNQSGVNWGCISPAALTVEKDGVLLDRTIGIANSSIKTSPGIQTAIQSVQQELLKHDNEGLMSGATGAFPTNELFYEGVQAGTLKGEAAATFKNSPEIPAYPWDWEFLIMQDKAWEEAASGVQSNTVLKEAQQKAVSISGNK